MISKNTPKLNQRRNFLKMLATIPFLPLTGVLGMNSAGRISEVSSNSTNPEYDEQISQLKKKLPEGKLGNLTVSRMILGCNPIIAWSHSRDLIYPNRLMKAYNTEDKIVQTLHLAFQAGINTLQLTTNAFPVFNKYKEVHNEKMQTLVMATLPEKDFFSNLKLSVDNGADAIYIHGRVCDAYARAGNLDGLSKAMDYIRKQGLQAGVGAHCLETIQICEKANFESDFYFKTFHHDKYWSALPVEYREPYIEIGPSYTDHNKYCDNMWDLFPERTVEYLKEIKKPVIGFKVLAAGAIQPKVGFRYAFENGADFICVGMFDFQVIDNVNTTCDILEDLSKRQRQWFS